MNDLIIPQELAQQLVNYLKTRPYEEVFQLIGQLLQLQPAEREEDA